MDELESVDGIVRFHEMMFIQRGPDGKIEKLFDYQKNEIPVSTLFKSYLSVSSENGLTYKGEFIPLENAIDLGKKRALGYQRRTNLKGHKREEYL